MKKGKIFAISLLCIVTILPILACENASSQELEINTKFSIALLSLNTDQARNQWVVLIQKQLPKVGIGVYMHESTGWENIHPRTRFYPLRDYDYIPTYAEGGFDIFINDWSWEMDLNPIGHYDSNWIHFSNNYYQYSTFAYDDKLDEFLCAYDNPDTRHQRASELQAILYEDLPAISIVYEPSDFLLDQGIFGFSPLLTTLRQDHSENWINAEDTGLIYCTKFNIDSYNLFQTEKDNLWEQCVYGSLFQRNQTDYRWEPSIARNATIISNYFDYTFPHNLSIAVDIDPNARFSNGDPVLAEDVKYSYELHLATQNHFSEFEGLLTSYLPLNDSIVVVDSDTVSFDLNTVYNFPFSLLSYGLIDKSIVEPLILTHGYNALLEIPFSANVSDSLVTSCGPFELDSFNTTENKVVLTKNEYWLGSVPMLNNITFVSIPDTMEALSLLGSKQADVLDENYGVHYLENPTDDNGDIIEPSFDIVPIPSLTHHELGINMRHPIMGTGELTPVGTADAAKNIRHAISHAIPRNTIIDDMYDGVGKGGITPFPPGCVGFDTSLEPYAYDLDLAIEYIESAGYMIMVRLPCISCSLLLIPAVISLVFVVIIFHKRQKK